jgi:carboxymethylenebutenolidase
MKESQLMPSKISQSDAQNPNTFYLANPTFRSEKGVLVLHAWWGLNKLIRSFVDRLAGEGFIALAPDLYQGKIATTIEEAKKLRSKVKQQAASEQILQALDQLRTLSSENQTLGVVGFSLGGWWALWLAEQESSPISATVVFYGSRGGEYIQSRSAFQFHLAETDPYVSASGVKTLRKKLSAAGRQAEFHVYPGTGHWFFEDDRPEAYQPEAAELAWNRTLEFLKKKL